MIGLGLHIGFAAEFFGGGERYEVDMSVGHIDADYLRANERFVENLLEVVGYFLDGDHQCLIVLRW